MLSLLFNERVTIRRVTARTARNEATQTQLVDSTGFPLTVKCRISTRKRRLFTTPGNEKEGDATMAFRADREPILKDEDLVVAMLTAIQRYIEDVFSYGSGDTIRGLEFGERRILIEDGSSHFVAIVYRGDDASGRLRGRARGLCATIDEQFGRVIEEWNGDTAKVRGIAALLPPIWRKRPTKGSE